MDEKKVRDPVKWSKSPGPTRRGHVKGSSKVLVAQGFSSSLCSVGDALIHRMADSAVDSRLDAANLAVWTTSKHPQSNH